MVDVEPCDAVARISAPMSDGVVDFYFRDDVIFEVTNGGQNAEISLTSDEGEAISGRTSLDPVTENMGWQRVVFEPDDELDPSTGYTAELSYCGGDVDVHFGTSALGTPLDAPEGLSDAVFMIDLSDARITRPSQIAQALLTLIDHNLLLQLPDVSEDTRSLLMGAQDKETRHQDTCMPTMSIEMEDSLFDMPTFGLGPVDVEFSLAGYTVTLFDAISGATFTRDGQSFAGGRLQGSLDARDVVKALSGRNVLPTEDPDALCELTQSVGMPCSDCPDGSGYCVALEVRDVMGFRSDLDVVEVTEFDCHEDCEASCDNDECIEADDFDVCVQD